YGAARTHARNDLLLRRLRSQAEARLAVKKTRDPYLDSRRIGLSARVLGRETSPRRCVSLLAFYGIARGRHCAATQRTSVVVVVFRSGFVLPEGSALCLSAQWRRCDLRHTMRRRAKVNGSRCRGS